MSETVPDTKWKPGKYRLQPVAAEETREGMAGEHRHLFYNTLDHVQKALIENDIGEKGGGFCGLQEGEGNMDVSAVVNRKLMRTY